MENDNTILKQHNFDTYTSMVIKKTPPTRFGVLFAIWVEGVMEVAYQTMEEAVAKFDEIIAEDTALLESMG